MFFLDEKKMESKEVIQRKIENLEKVLKKMIFKKLESDVGDEHNFITFLYSYLSIICI